MNNRKRKHNNSDSYLTNTYDDQNGDFNDTYASTATPAIPSESDEYSMWLVRKPKKVSLDEIAVRFPKKIKSDVITRSFSTNQLDENGNFQSLECRFEKSSRPMFYVTTRREPTNSDADAKGILKPAKAKLKGIAWINDDHKINTDAVSDNIEVGQEYTTFALHSHHSVSIRRKPEVDESQLKERLKAYGTIIKK